MDKYKVLGFGDGVCKIADRRGNECYVDEDMSAWWRISDTIELSDGQVVFEGELSEYERLAKKYCG